MPKTDFSKIRVRTAPSPTGRPHIGTAYNALFNYVFARKHGGKFILRIEDTDRARLVPGAEEEIIESLHWLGLEPDEGPYRQSERLSIYNRYAEELVEKGAAYYCFCSEERLEEVRKRSRDRKEPPMYDGCCRELDPREAEERAEEDESYVIRLKVPREGVTKFTDLVRGEIKVENRVIDDQILLKSDGFPTYHLANVVDDHLMEITHIIRGEEWLSSTPKHILLFNAFGWEPPIYAHTPLLRGKDRSKLSKRHEALPILDYREKGFLPEALLNYIALLGWTHPEEKDFFDLEEMIEKFELEDLNATAPVFDAEKLLWLNGKWIRSLSAEELAERISPTSAGKTLKVFADPTFKVEECGGSRSQGSVEMTKEKWLEIVSLVQERTETLAGFSKITDFFFEAPKIGPELLVQKGRTKEEAGEMLEAAMEILSEGNLDRNWLEKEFRAQAEERGWKMGELCMTARVAITGKTASPPLFESIKILGSEETLSRLQKALELL